jgi:phospholipase C
MYVVSPWSKGGWVNSQVFDHTSVGQFLEKRFGVVIPGITPWHRAVSGDLTSAFDFVTPNDPGFPKLPDASGSSAVVLAHIQRPRILPPEKHQALFQETGVRPSRALPYDLNASAKVDANGVTIDFRNTGKQGAVFHVYDRLHLYRIPKRYTVEAGKSLSDTWSTADDSGRYDLFVIAPNGFRRDFTGDTAGTHAELDVRYQAKTQKLQVTARNSGKQAMTLKLEHNAYGMTGDELALPAGGRVSREWSVAETGNWYDFTISEGTFARRAAGRIETGKHGVSDPAMGSAIG